MDKRILWLALLSFICSSSYAATPVKYHMNPISRQPLVNVKGNLPTPTFSAKVKKKPLRKMWAAHSKIRRQVKHKIVARRQPVKPAKQVSVVNKRVFRQAKLPMKSHNISKHPSDKQFKRMTFVKPKRRIMRVNIVKQQASNGVKAVPIRNHTHTIVPVEKLAVSRFSKPAKTVAKRTPHNLFIYPVDHGKRIDYCYLWSSGCGQKAAKRFCQMHGYHGVKQFAIDAEIGRLTPTVVIGSKRVCSGNYCDGFKFIECA